MEVITIDTRSDPGTAYNTVAAANFRSFQAMAPTCRVYWFRGLGFRVLLGFRVAIVSPPPPPPKLPREDAILTLLQIFSLDTRTSAELCNGRDEGSTLCTTCLSHGRRVLQVLARDLLFSDLGIEPAFF